MLYITYVYSLPDIDSIIFSMDKHIENINSTHKSIKMKNYECEKLYYDTIIRYDFICLYRNKPDEFNHKLVNGITSIIREYMNKNKNDFNNLFNHIFNSIKKIFNDNYTYIIDYIIYHLLNIYDKIYILFQEMITKDEFNEIYILPPPNRVRYFTEHTIDRYHTCLDMLESLSNTACISTNKEHVKEFIKNLNK